MAVELLTAVFNSSLPPTDRLVALALADYASPDGTNVYPSVQRIMSRTGLTRRSVQRSLRALEDLAVLIEDGWRKLKTTGGEQQVRAYRFQGGALPTHPSNAGGATDADKGAPQMHEGGATVTPKPSTEPSTESVRRSRFDEFWAVYPVKRDKPAAKKAWDKAVKDTDPQIIIDAVPAYVAELARSDVSPKYPQGWLTGRRWEDEPISTNGNGHKPDRDLPLIKDLLRD